MMTRIEAIRVWAVVTTIAVAACFIPARATAQQQAAPDAAAYLLVVDHSGSMNSIVRGTRQSRWQQMQERAVAFVRTVPLESRIWLAVFSSNVNDVRPYVLTLNTEQDRQALIRRIQTGIGRPTGGTALYDTLGLAFEEAERLSAKTPGRYIAVMVFTDGQDENSRRWRNRADLERRFGQLISKNKNLWLFMTPLAGTKQSLTPGSRTVYGSAKIPISVRVSPATVTLASPKQSPQQAATIKFDVSAQALPFVANKQVTFSFVPNQGDPVRVRVGNALYSLKQGTVDVLLEVTNASTLDGSREHGGELRIKYPELPGHVIQGPTSVGVRFLKQEPPKIDDLRPTDGSTFAAGQPVVFLVNTLQGAKVLWDFGDGTSDGGERVVHTYNTAGSRKVTVKVTAGSNTQPIEKTVNLEIIDVGVTIDPLKGQINQDQLFTFTATPRGGVTRLEWVVNGRVIQGTGEKGNTLAYTFNRDGRHLVSVRAVHPKITVESPELSVDVIGKPNVVITEPQANKSVVMGQPTAFLADVDGPVESVTWTITPKGASQPIATIERPVEQVGARRVSRLDHTFAETSSELTDGSEATVTATGNLPANVQVEKPVTSAVPVRLVAPTRSVTLTQPAVGQKLYFDDEIEFVAEVIGPNVNTVKWTIDPGDGSPPQVIEAPVAEEGGKRIARLKQTFPEADADLDLRVSAEGVLPVGYVTKSPFVESLRKVKHKLFDFAIEVAKQTYKYGEQPIQFKLEPAKGYEKLTWDFGDGKQESGDNATPSHQYKATGTYKVAATVTGRGNRQYTSITHVTITATPPVAAFAIHHDGKETLEVKEGDVIEFVELDDEPTGDIAIRTWYVDGKAVEEGKVSTVLDELGEHEIKLVVQGPPDQSGKRLSAEKTLAINVLHRPDHVLFVITAVLALGVLAVTWRWLAGNNPLAWKVYYSAIGTPDEDADPMTRVSKYWKWWKLGRKYAELPMGRLFIESEYWGGGAGKGETLTVDAFKVAGRYSGSVTYSGEGNDSVTCPPPTEDGKRIDYKIKDNRCKEDEYQQLHIRLVKETYNATKSWLVRLAIAMVLSGVVWYVWQHVYRQ